MGKQTIRLVFGGTTTQNVWCACVSPEDIEQCDKPFKETGECREWVITDPGELAETEMYARIGRAVEEWLAEVNQWLEHAVYGNAQPRSLITELAEVIAKARRRAHEL